ncbi:helix-turn-helix transcriptional regulator [Rhodoferax sp. UBA5149]|uniref:helix-turn-helix transcriptional regulator n=1 Tax=Rhodoferax sp. UBA5149 TaxID=1947379 RepID=UPI0025F0E0F9|nr:helix-turn-helix transcriptional regulator [Rhodoferax sp. UBA5149]
MKSNQPDRHSLEKVPMLLQLAARLHTARANPDVWRETLLAFQDCTPCHGVLDLAPDAPLGPDDLAALAGCLTHCANYGDECGDDASLNGALCAAFAAHMHTAAAAAHKTLQAGLFDQLPPTWIVDRNAQVREANTAAKALTQSGERVSLVGTRLELAGPGGARALLKALAKAGARTRLPWTDGNGRRVSFMLRALSDATHIAVTALLDAPDPMELALALAEQLRLTPRQSELAAHLLADQTLAGAARAMGISRHTANEHLAALEQRTGVPDRRGLLVVLRRVTQR